LSDIRLKVGFSRKRTSVRPIDPANPSNKIFDCEPVAVGEQRLSAPQLVATLAPAARLEVLRQA
jgi:hypothetical protein